MTKKRLMVYKGIAVFLILIYAILQFFSCVGYYTRDGELRATANMLECEPAMCIFALVVFAIQILLIFLNRGYLQMIAGILASLGGMFWPGMIDLVNRLADKMNVGFPAQIRSVDTITYTLLPLGWVIVVLAWVLFAYSIWLAIAIRKHKKAARNVTATAEGNDASVNFIISANTDIGIAKSTNQDSLTSMIIQTPQGKMAFTVLCDGMGGLAKGEVASASVINAFRDWAHNELPKLCQKPLQDAVIRKQWQEIVTRQNQSIKAYGQAHGVRLGTTVVAMLLTQDRYYILNVGDSRAYELTTCLRQITEDQSLVAREVALGHITPEEAEHDSRRNVLLQCVGASDEVHPDLFFGEIHTNAVYVLCTDGFRHEITPEELFDHLQPDVLLDYQTMQVQALGLIELNKQRLENDNISVALVRTY